MNCFMHLSNIDIFLFAFLPDLILSCISFCVLSIEKIAKMPPKRKAKKTKAVVQQDSGSENEQSSPAKEMSAKQTTDKDTPHLNSENDQTPSRNGSYRHNTYFKYMQYCVDQYITNILHLNILITECIQAIIFIPFFDVISFCKKSHEGEIIPVGRKQHCEWRRKSSIASIWPTKSKE